jgi:hypothetical protein
LEVTKRLREAVRSKRLEGLRNKTWILHHYNAPAHTLLLIHELLAKHEMIHPPTALLSRFGPCGLVFVPEVEIRPERSLISDDRRDRRNFTMGPAHYPTKRILELEKTLGAVYEQWRGVL